MRIVGADPLESEVQVAAAQYLDLLSSPMGDGKLFWHHVPNGGYRDKNTARVLKKHGVKPGIPDIVIDEIPPYFPGAVGVKIELKRKSGKPSDVTKDQKAVLKRYEIRGYRCYVCFGIDQFIAAIKECGF